MPHRRHDITTRILEGLITGGAALVALVLLTGGFTIDVWVFTIRARDWVRPLIGTLLLFGLYVAFLSRAARRHGWSAVGLGFAWTSKRFLDLEGSPNIKREESRYPVVADYLQRTTPPDAVVFAAQHSGSIRYCANRLTLRWDLLRPEDLRPAVTALRDRGRRTYVALEGTEQERFRRNFAEPLRTIDLAPLGETSHVQMWELLP